MTGYRAGEVRRALTTSWIRRFTQRRASWIPVFAAVGILVALLVAGQVYFGNFITPRVLSSLLLDNAYLLILAVGMTFVILTAGIDLSVGAVLAFTAMLGAKHALRRGAGWPWSSR